MGKSKIELLLMEYAESHQSSINKAIHWVCVPVIFFTIFGMIRSIPVFLWMKDISPWLNWSNLILVLVLSYYFLLSKSLFFGFIIWSFFVSYGNELLLFYFGSQGLLLISIGLFVIAWIGQFIGHGIEGKKPSFLKDVQFLLIGPAWLMNFILKVVELDRKKL